MSETVKLKVEDEYPTLCHGCLSQSRRTAPIPPGELGQIFLYMLTPQVYASIEQIKLCWECMAMLRKFTKFRNQLLHAQNTLIMLYDMDTTIPTLSNLKTTSKVDFDQSYEFISELPTPNTMYKEFDLQINTKNIPDTTITNFTKSQVEKIDVKLENDFDDTAFDSDTDIKTDKEFDIKTSKNERRTTENQKQRKLYDEMKRKFMKHAIIKTLNIDWSNEKNINKYFTVEYLDEHQIEEYQLKRFRKSCSHKCKFCNKQFYMRTDYLRHKNLNHRNKQPDHCLVCKKKFQTLEKLQQHWKHAHSCYSRCIMCHMYCKKLAQRKHLITYHTKLYSCDECGEQLLSANLFNVHYKTKHSTFICDNCTRTFHFKRTLIKHIRAAHSDNHKCEICHKQFLKRRRLVVHLAKHPELSPEGDREAAYCVECDRQYASVHQYKHHLSVSRKHRALPVKSIPCPECGKIFRRTAYMKNHLYKTHMKEKAKHFCELCGKYFTNNWGLKVHYNYVHLKLPKPKNDICDLCGRGFACKRTLLNHRRTHTGERPHSCQYCSAAFVQKVALLSHQKTHHRDRGTLLTKLDINNT